MNNNSTNLPICSSILPNPQVLGRGIGILPQAGSNQARSPIDGRWLTRIFNESFQKRHKQTKGRGCLCVITFSRSHGRKVNLLFSAYVSFPFLFQFSPPKPFFFVDLSLSLSLRECFKVGEALKDERLKFNGILRRKVKARRTTMLGGYGRERERI